MKTERTDNVNSLLGQLKESSEDAGKREFKIQTFQIIVDVLDIPKKDMFSAKLIEKDRIYSVYEIIFDGAESFGGFISIDERQIESVISLMNTAYRTGKIDTIKDIRTRIKDIK